MRIILSVVLVVCILSGCEKEIPLKNIGDTSPKLKLDGFFLSDTADKHFLIGKTISPFDNNTNASYNLDNPNLTKVVLTKNGNPIGLNFSGLTSNSSTAQYGPFVVSPLATYELEVSHPGFDTIRSKAKVPASVYLNQVSGLPTSVTADETIELGEEIDIEAIYNSDHVIFEWELLDTAICAACVEFTDAPQFTRLYQVQAIDTLTNCQAFDEKLVTVEKLRNVYIPNTFSPNGDGLNDLFTVATGEDVATVLSLKIFNRWGAQVYGRDNIGPNELAGWDGSYGGEKAENGIYVFVSEVLFKDGFRQVYRGDLTLMR